MKDWNVTRITLSTEAKQLGENNVQYPYWVAGEYGPECRKNGEREEFFWGLPKRFWDNPRYDLSGIIHDERTIK